ncbi:MAG: AAA family ATPase [Euryarchaeota archaeon]|jgi:replication factor C large subunit|nr:AAA family ATPase [Euryarchaeota archaeon]
MERLALSTELFHLYTPKHQFGNEHSKPVACLTRIMAEAETVPSDWTERYRPQRASDLEGNEAARKRIQIWLESWKKGTPSKKGLLLAGPPGIGKTSIVRAIAQDLGWVVIELNASDARNAASIRKAAGGGAKNYTFSLDGSFDLGGKRKTLILLDEVDHLHGGLREVSEQRIEGSIAVRRGEDSKLKSLKGDSGGKAELLKMLKTTTQPVIMTCNDEMGLWGRRNSSWKSARDRFLRQAELIKFRRASATAMLKIAKRVLTSENMTSDPGAINRLVQANPGDIRALVRDLQMICEDEITHIDLKSVELQLSRGLRDQQLDLFPGLTELYNCSTAKEASDMSRTLEITPRELIAWASWNNGSVFKGRDDLYRSAVSCSHADQAIHTMYRNNAYRSWYWAGQLSSLSMAISSSSPTPDRISLSYPEFLRRGNEPWRRVSLIGKLSKLSGSSTQAAREELWPPLAAIHEMGDNTDPEDFTISQEIGLDGDEHAMLHGLKSNLKSTKAIVERYNDSTQNEIVEEVEEPEPEEHVEKTIDKSQRTLF